MAADSNVNISLGPRLSESPLSAGYWKLSPSGDSLVAAYKTNYTLYYDGASTITLRDFVFSGERFGLSSKSGVVIEIILSGENSVTCVQNCFFFNDRGDGLIISGEGRLTLNQSLINAHKYTQNGGTVIINESFPEYVYCYGLQCLDQDVIINDGTFECNLFSKGSSICINSSTVQVNGGHVKLQINDAGGNKIIGGQFSINAPIYRWRSSADGELFQYPGSVAGSELASGTYLDLECFSGEIQFRSTETYLQWKYDYDDAWNDLVPLSSITGADGNDGADGREVELRVTETHIQWKYDTEESWHDLAPLSSITGADGNDGADGREVELRTNTETGYIQWRYAGDADWTNLTALSALKGEKGDTGESGLDGLTPFIGQNGNWWLGTKDTGVKASPADGKSGADGRDGRDGLSGSDGINGADGKDGISGVNGINGKDGRDGKDGIDGKDGAAVELRATQTAIQWRYAGESDEAWRDLTALSNLQTPKTEETAPSSDPLARTIAAVALCGDGGLLVLLLKKRRLTTSNT